MAFRDDREHLRAKADALEGELAQTREELAATKRKLEEAKNPTPESATPDEADGPVSSAWSFVFSGLRFGSTPRSSRADSRLGSGRRGGLLGGAEGALAALGAVVRLFGLVLMPLMLILAVFGDGDADDLDADGFESTEAVTAEERHQNNMILGGLGLVMLAAGGGLLAWYLTAP